MQPAGPAEAILEALLEALLELVLVVLAVQWLNIRWARRTRICNERQLHYSLQSITTLQLTDSTRNST